MKYLYLAISFITALYMIEGVSLVQQCANTNQTCGLAETCCEYRSQEEFGCCPLVGAICCKDKLHCCPQGYQCDKNLLCKEKASSSVITNFKIEFKNSPKKQTNDEQLSNKMGDPFKGYIECLDGISLCAENATCCKLVSGQYGCCPMLDATCCSDLKHCCPSGWFCNLTYFECYVKPVNSEYGLVMYKQPSAKISSVSKWTVLTEYINKRLKEEYKKKNLDI